ncbi:hypothetical protein GALMADRAFT_80104 [Galerina marginata CBS 339.88]|uniref:Uncharacterized protein n=1 Tax=Galerina marginata (strain CBS 339.88) TaxID=685588 RepID=A0A067S8F7_GALM3|nr:hypothetical protein GALMADRAFT_80104 [Galerina marginata CBS 339.88]
MGPGSRHDLLDDHFGFWNYEKYIGMGKTLMRRYQKALPERNKQVEAHNGFTSSLNPDDVAEWTKMCEDWDRDEFPRSVENPYYVEGADITQEKARKALEEEEQRWLDKGGTALHEISPSLFLIQGLDIEDAQ